MSTPTKNMKRRLNVAVTLCLVVFTVWIFINLFQVAITDSQKYQALANRNQFGSIPIHANRGSIYDKNGQILAQSATVFNIILNPRIFQQNFDDKETAKAKAEMLADKLNELFGTDKEKFIEKTAITLACRMSIKANDYINLDDMKYLLTTLRKCQNPFTCPHGRPTIISYSIYDLEKLFKRAID